MKFLTRITACAGVLLLMTTACSRGPSNDPEAEKVVKDALRAVNEATSGNFIYDFAFEAKEKGTGTTSFEATVHGGFDANDLANPKIKLAVEGSGEMEQDKSTKDGETATMPRQEFTFEVRIVDEIAYFLVQKAPQLLLLFQPTLETEVVGKWWKIEVPPEMRAQLNTLITFGMGKADEATMTPEQKKLRDMIQNSSFLTNFARVGEDDGAVKYSAYLDPDKVLELVDLVAQSDPSVQMLDGDDRENLRKVLEQVDDEPLFIWVDESGKTVQRISFEFKLNMKDLTDTAPNGERVEGTLGGMIDMSFSDLNEAVLVEVPEGAETFSPSLLFGVSPEENAPTNSN